MYLIFRIVNIVAFALVLVNEAYSRSDVNYSEAQLFQRLNTLAGKNLTVGHNKTTFSIKLINKITTDGNITVSESNGSAYHILGRSNDTFITGGDYWTLLIYGGGDSYNVSIGDTCNGTRKANILIYCDRDVHEPVLKYLGYNQKWNDGGCFHIFELVSCSVCAGVPDEGLSNGSVFCILFLTSVGVYLIIGICYRRLVKGAKGFEQIPHHRFWTRLGNLQADGCNFVCRRGEEETWQRLATSAKDLQDDQDDALLRP